MKFKISEKRAAYLKHSFFNYSFEGRELDVEVVKTIEEPIELHYLAQNHNYDDGIELLQVISSHPKCDVSTAKMIFFRSDVDGFIKDKKNCGDTNLIASILENFKNNFYSQELFYYNPDLDPDSLHFDREEFMRQYSCYEKSIFSKPKGRKITSFAEEFHQRNLKFYEGNLTITHEDERIHLKTPNVYISFKIPLGFEHIKNEIYDDFITSWKFSDNLKRQYDTSDKALKKVLIKPELIIENDDFVVVMSIFNSKPLKLIDSLTNVSTILKNELVYLQAFIDIVGIEDEFRKFKRTKHDDVWFVSTKIMQIKLANIDTLKYLKFLSMEVDGILFSIFIIANKLENFEKEIINEIIKSFSISK